MKIRNPRARAVGPSPSLRQKIVSHRATAIRYVVLDVAVTAGSAAYVAVSGRLPWLLILTGWEAAVVLQNCRAAIAAHQALRIYDANPAAAYLSEVRHAFR